MRRFSHVLGPWTFGVPFVIASCFILSISFLTQAQESSDRKSGHNAYDRSDVQDAFVLEHLLPRLQGCYRVSYLFVEGDPLDDLYHTDAKKRVYSTEAYEWVEQSFISSTRVRLQHVLYVAGHPGSGAGKDNIRAGFSMKHFAEEFELVRGLKPALLEYQHASPDTWQMKQAKNSDGAWLRRVFHLYDGPRYQMTGHFTPKNEGAHWEFYGKAYAPIPGRETRDMRRKDYQGLMRETVMSFSSDGRSFYETQKNIKVQEKSNKVRKELVNEIGKVVMMPIDDAYCGLPKAFVEKRAVFWKVLRETWDEVYAEISVGESFVETTLPVQDGNKKVTPRYKLLKKLEDKYVEQDLTDSEVRKKCRDEILKIIRQSQKVDGAQ